MMTMDEMIKNWSIAQKADAVLPCPRCGLFKMSPKLSDNALSRRADVYVCSMCGTDEALGDMRSSKFAFVDDEYNRRSLSAWWLSKTVLGKQNTEKNEHGNYVLVINRDVRLTSEDIDDIMVGALEGGCNYWCDEVKVVEDEYLGEFASEQISRGGSLIFHDSEDDEEYTLDLEKFLTGFALACKQGRGDDWFDEEGGVDCCQIDAPAADTIIQFALFGDVVYG